MCTEDTFPTMDRRNFLKMGGAGLAGAVLLGNPGGRVLAQARSSLRQEFESAAREYEVPLELLLAMGYVNTLWEMPPPSVSDYERGDLHGRGDYGLMQLTQNPTRDTLGRAADLAGRTEEEVKTDRAANVRAGAALLDDIQGDTRPDGLDGWQEAVAEYADTDLYAEEVFRTLESGASATTSTGESLKLAPQDVEVPQLVTALGRADYRRARWYGAGDNYTNSNRGARYIDYVVLHVAEGSYSGTINWFRNRGSDVSAHYVVSRDGRVAQCVRNEDIAWHAGVWYYNKKSIGIEHAGYGRYRSTWTRRMYRSSARLSAHLARRYNIPINRRHFIPHRRVRATKCPGRHFDLRKYLRLVRHFR